VCAMFAMGSDILVVMKIHLQMCDGFSEAPFHVCICYSFNKPPLGLL
jgi:hypothetical protein